MKKKKLKYIWLILLLATLAVGFYFIRVKSTNDMQRNTYKNWSKYYVVTHGKSAYVKTATSDEGTTALSEGQGYGMYIAIKAAKKGITTKSQFAKLYKYYMNHRTANTQLMSWKQNIKTDGSIEDLSNSATDGDLYIAYALIKASELWSDQADTYKKQARLLLKDILTYNYNSETKSLTVGNWAVKGTDYYDLVRTSDILPEQFDVFYQFSKDETWKTIKTSMLASLEKMSRQHKTGLLPDFMWVRESGEIKAAKANLIASKYDGDYYYNACRMPYNLAVPMLGICLGMQLTCVEYARHVLNLEGANSAELDPDTKYPVIDIMRDQIDIEDMGGTLRLGLYPCKLKSGSKTASAYSNQEVVQRRHRHRYEFNNAFRQQFEEAGFVFSGVSPDNRLVEVVELSDKKFFVAAQYHPELQSRPNRPEELYTAFITAAVENSQAH